MSPPLQVIKQATTTVPSNLLACIAANPGQSAFFVTNGILIFTPAALTAPLLATMGFGAAGPVAGSIAASVQSMLGSVGAGSVFAYLQSAGMAGYGTAAVNGIVQGTAMVSTGLVSMYSWFTNRTEPVQEPAKEQEEEEEQEQDE